MMEPRIDYAKIAPDAVRGMYATNSYFDKCSVDQLLRRLVELRVSQINGCSYCIALHTQQAIDLGESEGRLSVLETWRSVNVFTEAERASLDWAEANTRIIDGAPSEKLFDRLKQHFQISQIIDLTAIASNMNALNRMAISLGYRDSGPPPR